MLMFENIDFDRGVDIEKEYTKIIIYLKWGRGGEKLWKDL